MMGRRTGVIALAGASVLLLAGCSLGSPGTTSSSGSADAAKVSAAKVDSVSQSSGGVTGGTTLTISGTGLTVVKSVEFAGTAVPTTTRSATRLSLTVPAAKNFAPASVPITLQDADGTALYSKSYRYEVLSPLDKQMQYVLKYWKHYNPAYQALPDDDCVDFTSQSMLLRGWKPQGDWTPDADNIANSGVAWRSSTALRNFLEAHPELATALTDKQRDQVKVGDIVQFDWDGTGDRDHTGVVSRVVKTSSGIEIDFAGHTNDSDYRSVDTAITKDHPGGTAFYWSVK